MLYLITNRHAFPHNDGQFEAIRRAAEAGCPLIQIREKDLSARALTAFTRRAIELARPRGARILVNDRFDVALAAGADGVHLPVRSLPAADVRRVARARGLSDFLIGVSTHSIAEALETERAGADFAVFGPVFDTPSKRAYGAPLGLDRLAEVCQAVHLPVLALGGLTRGNFSEAIRHGAAGVAAIGLFTDLDQIQDIVQSLLRVES